jgi:hypothetical protein
VREKERPKTGKLRKQHLKTLSNDVDYVDTLGIQKSRITRERSKISGSVTITQGN